MPRGGVRDLEHFFFASDATAVGIAWRLGGALGCAGLAWGLAWRRPAAAPLGLALSGTLAYALGFRIEGVRALEGSYWSLGAWSFPLTVGWVLLVARALGALRRLEGSRTLLAVAWLVSLTLWTVVWAQGQELHLALGLGGALVAALTVALGWGWSPSRAGAQGIGVLLALLSVAGVAKTSAAVALLVPPFVLGLPPLLARGALGAWALARRPRVSPAWLGAGHAALSSLSVLAVLAARRPEGLLPASLAGLALGLGGLALVRTWTGRPVCLEGSRVRLFGVSFDRLTLAGALARVERALATGRPCRIATPDTVALMRAGSDPLLRRCYAAADLVVADGIGIVWAARWLGAPLPARVAGIDLMQALCARAAARGHRVFLLGGRPGVAAAAARRLRARYPGLNVVGTHHGYVTPAAERALVRRIRAARADLLFVGLGVPRQERWLERWREALGVPVTMGVGGSFDVLSGRLPRAPRAWQRMGLEWLYRLCREPRRLGRVRLIPCFLVRVAWVRLAYGLLGSTTSTSSS